MKNPVKIRKPTEDEIDINSLVDKNILKDWKDAG
jgi:hypothetical protein